jgi:CMP-2-keto-3-deoxyoctulosonic acid synthetase
MTIVMKHDATARDISNVIARVRLDGYEVHLSEGELMSGVRRVAEAVGRFA